MPHVDAPLYFVDHDEHTVTATHITSGQTFPIPLGTAAQVIVHRVARIWGNHLLITHLEDSDAEEYTVIIYSWVVQRTVYRTTLSICQEVHAGRYPHIFISEDASLDRRNVVTGEEKSFDE